MDVDLENASAGRGEGQGYPRVCTALHVSGKASRDLHSIGEAKREIRAISLGTSEES